MAEIVFQGWPKISRLYRDMVITEKLDGTNGAVIISEDRTLVGAQSRNRIITPDEDNHGFARWVYDNAGALADVLGPGRHFGEWWGRGINRGYGLTEKRFSLFNVARWVDEELEVDGLDAVPTLGIGPFDTHAVGHWIQHLRVHGSQAVPGFMQPEGVVVYLSASNTSFKATLENDDLPKNARAK